MEIYFSHVNNEVEWKIWMSKSTPSKAQHCKGRNKQHRKLKIEQHKPHKRLEGNSCGPEGQAVPAPLVATVMLLKTITYKENLDKQINTKQIIKMKRHEINSRLECRHNYKKMWVPLCALTSPAPYIALVMKSDLQSVN